MATTSLIIELLIIGFSVILSLIPLIATALNLNIQNYELGFIQLPLHIQLATAYLVGVIWNRIRNVTLNWYELIIIRKYFQTKEEFQYTRLRVISDNEQAGKYIEMQRGIVRICGALSIIILVNIFGVIVLSVLQKLVISIEFILYLEILLIFLFVIVFYSWYKLEKGYISAIYTINQIITKNRVEKRISHT